jgi:hypothetical protein
MEASDCIGKNCEWCGRIATHFCQGCQKCLCNSPICIAKSTAAATVRAARGFLNGSN